MGNSFCCNNFDRRQQVVLQSDLIYESLEEKENYIIREKDINSNSNHKSNLSLQKNTNIFSPKSSDENDFINPLPEIVVIKFKRH